MYKSSAIKVLFKAIKKNKYKDFFILFLFMLIEGIISIYLGADGTWDTANYHLYNPFAFLNNRYNLDIMPSGIQTFFTPFPDIPFYLLIKYFNNFPFFIAFIQGSIGGILIFFVYKLSTLLLGNFRLNWLYILCSIIMGTTGTMFIFELGTGLTTIQASIFVLAALYLLLKNLFNVKQNYRLTLFAGILSGIAIAEKFTSIIFVLSISASICFLYKNIENPFKQLSLYMITAFSVFIALNSFWTFFVFNHTGNPFFPFYNNIFKSDMTEFISYQDTRFLDVPLLQKIFYPFYWISDNFPMAFEAFGPEFRYPAAYVSVFCLVIFYYVSRSRAMILSTITKELFNKHSFVFMFVIFSYIIWCFIYCTARYMIPIEVLCGLLICLFIQTISKILNKQICGKFFCLITTAVILINTPYSYLDCNRYPIQQNEKYIHFEDLKIQDNNIVLLFAKPAPLASLILFQNPKARFIALSNTHGYDYIYSDEYKNKIKNLISENQNNIKIIYSETHLYSSPSEDLSFKNLNEFYDINSLKCRIIKDSIPFVDYYYCE